MGIEAIVPIITSLIAAVSAGITGFFAWKYKQRELAHEKELKKLKLAQEDRVDQRRLQFETEAEAVRRSDTSTVDMSSIMVKAQEALSDGFSRQLAHVSGLYEDLTRDFEAFKKSAEKSRREYEALTQSLRKQIYQFQNILSAIKFNLMIMGSRIDDIYGTIDAEDKELLSKVKRLSTIHATIVTSLDSVKLDWDVDNNVTISFKQEPLTD